MKRLLLAIILAGVFTAPVSAQPPHACGALGAMTIIYDRVDAGGFAPRFKAGSEQQFDCIAARDTNFDVQRFRTSVDAANYWLSLLGQELGVPLQPIPVN